MLNKNISVDYSITIYNNILIDCITYTIDPHICYVLTVYNNTPIFLHPFYISNHKDIWYLSGKISQTIKFITHRFAYLVSFNDILITIHPNELLDAHSHRLYSVDSNNYVYTLFKISKYLDEDY